MGAVQATKDKGLQVGSVAAAAMYILVVTRTNDEWASWSEHDNMFVRCVLNDASWVCVPYCLMNLVVVTVGVMLDACLLGLMLFSFNALLIQAMLLIRLCSRHTPNMPTVL